MAFARDLIDRLPATVTGMCSGEVTWAKAMTILDQTEDLTPEQTAALEEKILPWGVGKTPGQVRDKLRREVLRLDPEAAVRRRKKATAKRRVALTPLPDGMADLTVNLPGADAVLVYNWLDEHARAAKSSGDSRTLDQLRADAHLQPRPRPRTGATETSTSTGAGDRRHTTTVLNQSRSEPESQCGSGGGVPPARIHAM